MSTSSGDHDGDDRSATGKTVWSATSGTAWRYSPIFTKTKKVATPPEPETTQQSDDDDDDENHDEGETDRSVTPERTASSGVFSWKPSTQREEDDDKNHDEGETNRSTTTPERTASSGVFSWKPSATREDDEASSETDRSATPERRVSSGAFSWKLSVQREEEEQDESETGHTPTPERTASSETFTWKPSTQSEEDEQDSSETSRTPTPERTTSSETFSWKPSTQRETESQEEDGAANHSSPSFSSSAQGRFARRPYSTSSTTTASTTATLFSYVPPSASDTKAEDEDSEESDDHTGRTGSSTTFSYRPANSASSTNGASPDRSPPPPSTFSYVPPRQDKFLHRATDERGKGTEEEEGGENHGSTSRYQSARIPTMWNPFPNHGSKGGTRAEYYARQCDTQYLDSIAVRARPPASAFFSLKELSVFLTGLVPKFATPDLVAYAKLRVVCRWIAENIAYDVDALRENRVTAATNDPENALRRRMTVCGGYSKLLSELMLRADIQVHLVSGWSAGGRNYRVGDRIDRSDRPEHAWSCVELGGERYLIDLTWASGYSSKGAYVKCWQDHYFLTPPQRFAVDHLPEESFMQLLDPPISHAEYSAVPRVTPAFWRAGMSFRSKPQCVLTIGGKGENGEEDDDADAPYANEKEEARIELGISPKWGYMGHTLVEVEPRTGSRRRLLHTQGRWARNSQNGDNDRDEEDAKELKNYVCVASGTGRVVVRIRRPHDSRHMTGPFHGETREYLLHLFVWPDNFTEFDDDELKQNRRGDHAVSYLIRVLPLPLHRWGTAVPRPFARGLKLGAGRYDVTEPTDFYLPVGEPVTFRHRVIGLHSGASVLVDLLSGANNRTYLTQKEDGVHSGNITFPRGGKVQVWVVSAQESAIYIVGEYEAVANA